MAILATPESRIHRSYYDFEICYGEEGLKQIISKLNYNGYELVSVTQTMDKYTVFFRRPAP